MRRTRRMGMRLSEEELTQLRKLADYYGLRMSDFVRSQILRRLRKEGLL